MQRPLPSFLRTRWAEGTRATALGCAKTRQFCCFIGPEGTVEKNLRDLAVLADFDTHVLPELERNIAQYDRLYLTIDLDVLPAREMPAVSAPAALGVPLAILLRIVEPLCRSGKLQAVDLVEFNPQFDIDGLGARAAARLAWQIAHWWR